MHNDGGSSKIADGRAYRSRLPAVIPPRRPPIALPHWRLAAVAALAAGVGIVSAALAPFQTRQGAVGRPLPAREAAISAAAPSGGSPVPPPVTIRATAEPSAGIDTDVCRASFPAPQLVVSGQPTVLPAEVPASLGVTVDGAPDGARVVVCGFAPKSVFSVGRSVHERMWTMPASDIADATLIPPQGFVGPMKIIVALVNTDRSLIDRRTLHLQWLPQAPGAMAMPRLAEINDQLEKGKRYKAAGDIAAARAIFLRLAQNGDSRAAFLLAETYDPIALAKHQLLPPDSDLEKARLWYRRASERGSPEAGSRLERLSNW